MDIFTFVEKVNHEIKEQLVNKSKANVDLLTLYFSNWQI